jgi:hypothetical protein
MSLKSNFSEGLPSNSEADCFTTAESSRSLVFTQADGTTEGFPLTWLYRWQWKKQAAHEVLILTLTEHEIAIHGKKLARIIEPLNKGTGLHLTVKEDRYQCLLMPYETLITQIEIQPHEKTQSPANPPSST